MTPKQEQRERAGVVVARAIRNAQKPDETNEKLGARVSDPPISKANMTRVMAGKGVDIDTAVNVARKMGWSLDEMFGIKPASRPPSKEEAGFRRVAAVVLEVMGYVDADGDVSVRPGRRGPKVAGDEATQPTDE